MRGFLALDVKALRDIGRLRGQLAAIAVVIACGVGTYVGMRSTMRSLDSTRSRYYAKQRFADAFARLKRAPERVAAELAAIPGVATLETRVVADVTLDVPGVTEPATGRLVSLPDRGASTLNAVWIRGGRYPQPNRSDEVLVGEAFATAHRLTLGARIGALINGKHELLRVVGIALSPEYTYAVAPGVVIPDDRRFGVFWMRREALAAAFDMRGAFNDVSFGLARDAIAEAVIHRVDHVLDRYGGFGAIARRDQASAFFLENELSQLRTFAWILPSIFLGVAAFLLNVIVGRIIAGQREQIAAMKAFGYRDREVGAHYAKLVGLVLAAGTGLGLLLAFWMGEAMTRLYSEYYRFPELPFEAGARDVLEGVGISAAAAVAGTFAAIRRTVDLEPAVALRPESPPVYRPTIVERVGLARFLPTTARLVLREVERKPARSAMSVVGIGLAIALTVLNSFTFDSIQHMLNVHYGLGQREDVFLTLREPRTLDALVEIEHLPGVLHAEPARNVPVRLRAGHRFRSATITGLTPDARLTSLLDADLADVAIPAAGLTLSRKLAELLGVGTGDRVHVEVLEGRRPTFDLEVARVVESFVGLSAHMELSALCRRLGEADTLDAARLLIDDRRRDELNAAVKDTPAIASVTSRDDTLENVRRMIDENLGTWVMISLSYSLAMSFGILFNIARIALAERARELASLRVLGFRRGEVSAILLGELGLFVAAAIPIGLFLGRILAEALVRTPGFDNEQFRLPLVISPATNALAVATVLVAAALSGFSAWRRLDRIDIVEVLKSRD